MDVFIELSHEVQGIPADPHPEMQLGLILGLQLRQKWLKADLSLHFLKQNDLRIKKKQTFFQRGHSIFKYMEFLQCSDSWQFSSNQS